MTETLFYHLERRSLEDVLPTLVTRTLERGQRVLIKADSADRASSLDNLLWTYDDQTFLPHAQVGDGDAKRQPVLITTEDENANSANVLFLVGGAEPPAWNGAEANAVTRIVLMFDGRDADSLTRARAAWKEAKAAGHDATYWKEMPTGKFEKQA
jgi:DNA polymerase-3 subunit chi